MRWKRKDLYLYNVIFYVNFAGFLKRNETNLKEEFAKKRPDLIEHIVWNLHTKAPSQNGIIGIIFIFSSDYLHSRKFN